MMELRDRYLNDSHFRALVDQMHAFIRAGEFTPSEVRLASMLATIQYESLHIGQLVRQERHMESLAMSDHDVDLRVMKAAQVLQSELDRVRREHP